MGFFNCALIVCWLNIALFPGPTKLSVTWGRGCISQPHLKKHDVFAFILVQSKTYFARPLSSSLFYHQLLAEHAQVDLIDKVFDCKSGLLIMPVTFNELHTWELPSSFLGLVLLIWWSSVWVWGEEGVTVLVTLTEGNLSNKPIRKLMGKGKVFLKVGLQLLKIQDVVTKFGFALLL